MDGTGTGTGPGMTDPIRITLFELAERFIGMTEVAGTASHPAILAMLRLDQAWPESDEVPWCSAALNWWCWLLRLPRSKDLRARSWLGVGRAVVVPALPDRLSQATCQAEVGFDAVILWRGSREGTAGHVGLFAGWEGDQVLLLGGNQGDRVCVAPFPRERILGIRRLRG